MKELTAADIMTRKVVTVPPEMPVAELARLLTEQRISGVPVLEEGRLIGMVSEGDLVDRVKRVHMPTVITILDAIIPIAGEQEMEDDLRKMAASTAGDIMTNEVDYVEEDASLSEIATILSENRIPLLPVLRQGQLVGIIGKRDVIKGMLASNGT